MNGCEHRFCAYCLANNVAAAETLALDEEAQVRRRVTKLGVRFGGTGRRPISFIVHLKSVFLRPTRRFSRGCLGSAGCATFMTTQDGICPPRLSGVRGRESEQSESGGVRGY